MARLGDICKIKSGYAFKSESFSNVGVPVVRIGNITSDGINVDYSICYDTAFWNDNSNYRVGKNDILVAMSGATVGKACINTLNIPLLLNQRVASIVCDNPITQKYVYHAINSDEFLKYVIDNSAGCAQPNISAKQLANFQLKVSDLKIQERIVTVLDGLSHIIYLRKQQLSKLDELVKSRFIEMFGNIRYNETNWKKVSLKSVAEVRGRVGWKGYKKDDLRESGPLVLGATHLTESGCIDLSSPVYLSREKYEESPEIMLQKNDLIFTQRGNTIGKVGLLENDIGEATINPCVLILRPLTINPIFFKTYFILDETKNDMWSLNAGSAQPMITQKGIGEYMLMLPPMELQNQFSEFVKQTDKSNLAIQKSLNQLETLKKSLMQKYFG